jgi:hypothetical protein
VLDAAHAVWAALGIGPLLREKMAQDGCPAPHETALCAMTANRLARPGSKLACDEHWLADDVSWPEAQGLALEHLDRALDCRLHPLDSFEHARCFRTAERFNADVDLVCWATTTRYVEIDEADEAGEDWQGRPRPARRPRGHTTEGRDGNPQVGVGRALTPEGLPGRSWVLPGHTADVPTMDHRQDAWRGWRVPRGVCVGDRGMFSEAHRQRLGRALGRYIRAVPRRTVTAGHQTVRSRPGRSRDVAAKLRVKAVWVGEGERRRRDVVCHNPDEAAREQAPRARLRERLRAALATLDARQADHPKKAGELRASRRFGRYLSREARGRLRIKATKVAAEAKSDGKFVVTTNDDTRDAADGALGYTRMLLIEGGFRRMKTTGRQTRPIDHGRPPRIIAQVQRCVLALLLERAAEIRCQQTWRTIRQTRDQLTGVRYRMHGKTIVQRTPVTSTMAKLLRSLGIPLPKRILEGSDETHASYLPSIPASQSPCVS